jgi:diguanylate cyclase (GGDEF)-like protein
MDYPGSRKIRVLFADADAAFGIFVRYSLEQIGFQVTVANDGADLIARFLPKEFDVVLVGIATPIFGGLQVLRAIKQRHPTTPVILFCDADSSHLAEEGMQQGAFVYFQKPLNDFAQLGDAITRAYETQVRHHPTVEPSAALMPPPAPESDALLTVLIRQLVEATRTQPLDVTIQMLSAAGAQIMQAPYGIVKLTRAGTELQVSGVHGFANHKAAMLDLAARLGDDLAARVIAEGRTVVASTPPESAGTTAQHAVGVPLLTQNQTRGALIVYPLAAGSVDAAHIAQLELIAAQGVLALELAQAREENARLIATDPITGMLKRELFLEMADREFRRSWRYDQPITAIIVDVDDLANINLKCGHTFGDQVLREVANVCTNVVRSIDLIGRYDGDAFALLLLMTESESAKVVAERLRSGINAILLANAPSPIQVAATLGVCSYPRDSCTSIFDLLALTQEAQRAARYRGANQIVYG